MRTIRSLALCAASAFLIAKGAGAQSGDAEWLPDAIGLPDDHKVVSETEVGSSNRMLLIELPGDAVTLLDTWRTALDEAGYQVEDEGEATEDTQVVFSGHGIRAGQIVVMPGTSDDVTLIQIDATLDG